MDFIVVINETLPVIRIKIEVIVILKELRNHEKNT